MRIAYLINQYPKVSHSFIRREILALEGQGFEIMRIALRGWDERPMDSADKAEQKRTRYVLRAGASALLLAVARMLLTRPLRFVRALLLAGRMSHRAERPFAVHVVYLAEACRIEPWLRAASIQHLHAHFGTNSAEVAMLVHILGGPPFSFTVHGPEEFDKAPLLGLGEKIRRCAFVVAVSSFGRGQLYRLAASKYWHKIKVVHCGLDQSFIESVAIPVPDTNRLVCVGRLCTEKGQLLLIEAARRLAVQGVNFTLVLAGDGELRPDIEALIARHQLQNNISITGWINSERVREEILNARALVLPSVSEGLPVVLMEAMALRRPVISTYVAGIPELVGAGENGWLVPAGDLDALTEAVRTCLETPTAELTRMGAAAHRRVLEKHDAEKEAAKLGNFIRAVKRTSGSAAAKS
jgi:colanic acid/amylovoran biosynthesis glycosyltransferase